jgi:hypothetical protein
MKKYWFRDILYGWLGLLDYQFHNVGHIIMKKREESKNKVAVNLNQVHGVLFDKLAVALVIETFPTFCDSQRSVSRLKSPSSESYESCSAGPLYSVRFILV